MLSFSSVFAHFPYLSHISCISLDSAKHLKYRCNLKQKNGLTELSRTAYLLKCVTSSRP